MSLLLALQGGAPPAITGTGAITAPVATLAATGLATFTGAGAITAPVASLSASGGQVFGGAATVTTPPASLAGLGLVVWLGSGQVTAPMAALAGSALEAFSGGGDLVAPAALLAGSGEAEGAPAPPTESEIPSAGAGRLVTAAWSMAEVRRWLLAVEGGGAVVAPGVRLAGLGEVDAPAPPTPIRGRSRTRGRAGAVRGTGDVDNVIAQAREDEAWLRELLGVENTEASELEMLLR